MMSDEQQLTIRQQHLVRRNIPLLYWVAKRLQKQRGTALHRLSQHEIESAAALGLVKAARQFDPKRGIKFSTYATVSIIRTIHHDARNSHIVRIPSHHWYKDVVERFGPELMAASRQALRATCNLTDLLEVPVYDHEPPDDARQLRAIVRSLPAKQREVIEGIYFQGKQQPQLADEMKLSRQRINQIKQEAERNLRKLLRKFMVPA